MLDYTIPTFAGFMMVVMIVEVDKNWAIATYCAVSLLSIFFLAFQYIFTSVDMLEGMEMFGKYAVLVLWAAANLFFFIYDYALTQLTDMYINWFRKKILRRK